MTKCNEIYTPEIIFAFSTTNLLVALGTAISSEEDINTDLLDILSTNKNAISLDYLLNRQDKYMSPLFERIYDYYSDDTTTVLTNTNTQLIAIIKTKYLKGWSKLADAFFASYNPINNYDMVESESGSGTSKNESNLSEDTETSTSETVTNGYKGFNSSNMQDVSRSSSIGSGSNDKTTSGSKTDNYQEDSNERELTRSGNIGVTTSQQMIESEYNLRKKNLLDIIYRDIDTILFIDYYN